MDCAQIFNNTEFFQQFHQKALQRRVPLGGTLSLSNRCNLQCVHCYLGRQNDVLEELSTKQWCALLDEIADAGCLYLLLTGGDPFLRKDFATIYTHAKIRGMIVSVFSNGTLVTGSLVDLFRDMPPRLIEISLYGATPETYEAITRVKGSFQKCLQGIEQLLHAHIPVALKTILMTINRHEFYAIEKMAKDYGVDFRFDAGIVPCFDGNRSPLDLRVSVEEVIEKEFSDMQRGQNWYHFHKRMKSVNIDQALYHCGSGRTAFYIGPEGILQPCLMRRSVQYQLIGGDFSTGWQAMLPQIRAKQAMKGKQCHECEKVTLCAYCPAEFELENGSEIIPSEYLCRLGHERFIRIDMISIKEE